jgi:hypothetical protein
MVCKITSISIEKIPQQNYTIKQQVNGSTPTPLEIKLPKVDFTPADPCTASLTWELIYGAGTDPMPAFISADSKTPTSQIKVVTSNFDLAGTYKFTLKATEPKSGASATTIPFDIVLIKGCVFKSIAVDTKNVEDKEYLIDPTSPTQLKMAVPKYTVVSEPATCQYTLNLSLSLTGSTTFPRWITEKPTTEIVVSTSKPELAGEYKFTVKAVEPSTPIENTELSFTITLKCKVTQISLVSGAISD